MSRKMKAASPLGEKKKFDIPVNANRGFTVHCCERAAMLGKPITVQDIKTDWARYGIKLSAARAREELKKLNTTIGRSKK